MTGDSSLGTVLQGWFGTGETAAYAAMFFAIGVYTIVMSFLSYSYPPLRNLERDIPDAAGLPSETDPRSVADPASSADQEPSP